MGEIDTKKKELEKRLDEQFEEIRNYLDSKQKEQKKLLSLKINEITANQKKVLSESSKTIKIKKVLLKEYV